MATKSGILAMKDFAAAHGLNRRTVGDLVELRNLPYVRIGNAKALPPQTQADVLRILGIKPATASA